MEKISKIIDVNIAIYAAIFFKDKNAFMIAAKYLFTFTNSLILSGLIGLIIDYVVDIYFYNRELELYYIFFSIVVSFYFVNRFVNKKYGLSSESVSNIIKNNFKILLIFFAFIHYFSSIIFFIFSVAYIAAT